MYLVSLQMADNFCEEMDKYRKEMDHNKKLLETINEMITGIREVCTDWAYNTKSYPQSAVLSVQVSFPAGPRGEHAC